MRTSESIQNIAKALAAAQGEIKNPEANEEVKVFAKKEAGGALLYSYKYATLPKCFDAARAPFAKNGLSHTAAISLGDRGADLVVRITHESGEWYEASVPLSAAGDAKARAGEITFWKRYLFNGLAGIAGDDDIKAEDGERGPAEGSGAPKAQAGRAAPSGPKAAPKAQTAPPAQAPPAASNEKEKPATPPAPGSFAALDAPPLKRPRAQILKEVVDAARRVGVGQDLVPPDMVSGLEVRVQAMFGKGSMQITEDELETLLRQLNSEGTGK